MLGFGGLGFGGLGFRVQGSGYRVQGLPKGVCGAEHPKPAFGSLVSGRILRKRKPGSARRLRRDGGHPLRCGSSCHHWGKAPEKRSRKCDYHSATSVLGSDLQNRNGESCRCCTRKPTTLTMMHCVGASATVAQKAIRS